MANDKLNFAKYLRHNQTEAEKILWSELRGRACGEHKFRRQVKIERYVVDFLCMSKKLIVEVDGPTHVDQKDYDNARTKHLENLGYVVIRFANEDVYDDKDAVVEAIYEALQI